MSKVLARLRGFATRPSSRNEAAAIRGWNPSLNASLISARAEFQLLLTYFAATGFSIAAAGTLLIRARNACCRVSSSLRLLEMAAPPFEINLAEVSTLDERQEFVSMVGVQAMVRATCLQVI